MLSAAQFYRCINECFHLSKVGSPARLAIALSGGVDSMCLAHLLSRYKKECLPDLELYSITIDHGYRHGSDLEAQKVAAMAEKWGINAVVSRLEYSCSPSKISNFEEVARTMRYAEFAKFCRSKDIPAIAVAHTLDDQIETFVQRLRQNSSLYGLAGLKKVTSLPAPLSSPDLAPLSVFRPLLTFPKSDLIHTCVQNHVLWYEDPTNQDPDLTERNYWRSELTKPPHRSRLSRSSLLECIHDVQRTVGGMHGRIEDLKRQIFGSTPCHYAQNGSLSFCLSHTDLAQLPDMIFGRFLFQILYPISASRDYHWMYAKLERQAVPRIKEHFKTKKDQKLKLTYLNVLMTIENDGGKLLFHFERQPLSRAEIAVTSGKYPADGEWFLFDNRFWLRVKSPDGSMVLVESYDSKKHKKLICTKFPELRKIKRLSLALRNTPILMADSLVAVPVLNKVSSTGPVKFGMRLKDNIFADA